MTRGDGTQGTGTRRIPRRLLAPLPALGVALVMWAWTRLHFDFPATLDGPGTWHYLGPQLLTSEPLASLLALHVQPPGVNVLRGMDLILTPGSHLALTATYLVLMLAMLWLVVDTLIELGLRARWAAACGLVLALMPATVLFALSANSTIPTMAACALSLWGVARLRRQPALGATASALGVVALFLFRSSFVWLFALVWLVALGALLWRSARTRGRVNRVGIAAVVIAGALVMVVQAHYLASFGVVTLSSWSGENVYKALRQSNHLHVTESALAAASELGPCHASLATAIASDNDVAWQPDAFFALPGCADLPEPAPTGVQALDDPSPDGVSQGNFNWSRRLQASNIFTEVMRVIVAGDPRQLAYMAVAGGASGSRDSGLAIYLAPPEDSEFMVGRRPAYPNKTLGGFMSLFFAPVGLFLTAAGLLLAVSRRDRSRLRAQPVFWFGVGLIGFHVAVSTLVEYGENNRFQAEIAPVLVVVGALVVSTVVPPRSARQPATPGSTRSRRRTGHGAAPRPTPVQSGPRHATGC